MAECGCSEEMPDLEPVSPIRWSAASPQSDTSNTGDGTNPKASVPLRGGDWNNNQAVGEDEPPGARKLSRPTQAGELEVLPGTCASYGGRIIIGADMFSHRKPVKSASAQEEDDSSNERQEKERYSSSSSCSPGVDRQTEFRGMDQAPGRPHQFTAKELAAQSLEAAMGGWLVFEPDDFEPSQVQLEAEKFLARYTPSQVQIVDGTPIFTISVDAPMDDSGMVEDERDTDEDDEDYNSDGEDNNSEDDEHDSHVVRLLRAWEDLKASGQQVTFQKIKELAVAHRRLGGKWMIMKKKGPHIDLTWERIFRATIAGRLGDSACVTTVLSGALGPNSGKHLICVFSKDFTDRADVMELERRLRAIGIRCHMNYKPDAFTDLGVYRRNEWGLRPSIYASDYDVGKNCSTIVSFYDE